MDYVKAGVHMGGALLTLGKHGDLTPDQARARAKELAGKVAVGVDPRAEEQRKRTEAEAAARRESPAIRPDQRHWHRDWART